MESKMFLTFTRNEYDPENYELEVKQSKDVGEYKLKEYYTHPKGDRTEYQENVEYYGAENQYDITKRTLVDIEGDLLNLDRKYRSRDVKNQYPFASVKKESEYLVKADDKLVTKYTRLEGPTFKRGLVYNDLPFSVPIQEPQSLLRIHGNNYIGENTYLTRTLKYKSEKPVIKDQTNEL